MNLTCCDSRNASFFAISPASARSDVVITQMLRQSCCWVTIAPWPWISTGELPYAFASISSSSVLDVDQSPSQQLLNLQLSNWRLCEAAATCQRLIDWRPHLQLWCGAVGAGDRAQPRAGAVGRPARVWPLPGGRHRAVLGVHRHRGGGAANGGTSVPASGGDAGGLLISPINNDLHTGSISWPESFWDSLGRSGATAGQSETTVDRAAASGTGCARLPLGHRAWGRGCQACGISAPLMAIPESAQAPPACMLSEQQ